MQRKKIYLSESEFYNIISEGIKLVLNEMSQFTPKVRGGWNKDKIIRYLKSELRNTGGEGIAVRWISQFNNINDFREHLFWHGSKHIQKFLKPSITFPKNAKDTDFGGGYGERYWGISLTRSKNIAANFATIYGHGVVHPIILNKNAVVERLPDSSDAADANEAIEDLWNRGVDAVWIGSPDRGEQELLVLNPKCIANIGRITSYAAYGLHKQDLSEPTDEELEIILTACKEFVANPVRKPQKPYRFYYNDDYSVGEMKPADVYNQELAQYNQDMKKYYASDDYKRKQDLYNKLDFNHFK